MQPQVPSAQTVITASQAPSAAALPGSYIVGFRSDPGSSLGPQASYFQEYTQGFMPLAQRFLPDPRVKDIQFLTQVDMAAAADAEGSDLGGPLLLHNMASTQEPQFAAIARVDFTSEADAAEALQTWEQEGGVWFAEPNYISRLSQASDSNLFAGYASSYEALSASDYWWLARINLQETYRTLAARDLSSPGVPDDASMLNASPIVAVLDSGVDYEHPALKERIWRNDPQDINASNCVNDLYGCNTTAPSRGRLGNGDVFPYDTTGPGQACKADTNCEHGTHVAGLIAGDPTVAAPGSSQAVAGVCPLCRIMILRIVGKIGKESGILDSSIIGAFKYVALFRRNGSPAVRVINASFGKFARSRAVALLVRQLKEKHGAVIIGAAGNEDTLSEEFPAAFSDAIAVAAVDSASRKEVFSNFGQWVDISAPGNFLTSSVPGGRSASKSGTSMAAPLVAGVAGLLLARYPGISYDDLRAAILHSADPSFYAPDHENGFNFGSYYQEVNKGAPRVPLLGYGVLNAKAALERTTTAGLPVYSTFDRVHGGCAVIAPSTRPTSVGLSLILLLLPALALLLRRTCSQSHR